MNRLTAHLLLCCLGNIAHITLTRYHVMGLGQQVRNVEHNKQKPAEMRLLDCVTDVGSWRDGGGRNMPAAPPADDDRTSHTPPSASAPTAASSEDEDAPQQHPYHPQSQPSVMAHMMRPGMGPGPRMGPAGPMMYPPMMPPFVSSSHCASDYVTVTEALVLRSLLEDRGRITESIRILVPIDRMKQKFFQITTKRVHRSQQFQLRR